MCILLLRLFPSIFGLLSDKSDPICQTGNFYIVMLSYESKMAKKNRFPISVISIDSFQKITRIQLLINVEIITRFGGDINDNLNLNLIFTVRVTDSYLLYIFFKHFFPPQNMNNTVQIANGLQNTSQIPLFNGKRLRVSKMIWPIPWRLNGLVEIEFNDIENDNDGLKCSTTIFYRFAIESSAEICKML